MKLKAILFFSVLALYFGVGAYQSSASTICFSGWSDSMSRFFTKIAYTQQYNSFFPSTVSTDLQSISLLTVTTTPTSIILTWPRIHESLNGERSYRYRAVISRQEFSISGDIVRLGAGVIESFPSDPWVPYHFDHESRYSTGYGSAEFIKLEPNTAYTVGIQVESGCSYNTASPMVTARVTTLPVASTSTPVRTGYLVKGSGPALYYVREGKRYVFTTYASYASWYNNYDAQPVQYISDYELASYTVGGTVAHRPGSLVKITTDPSVYVVEPRGVLRHVPSEAIAAELFGTRWARFVVDLPDAFFSPPTYTIGQPLAEDGTDLPHGYLGYGEDGAMYYFDGTIIHPVSMALTDQLRPLAQQAVLPSATLAHYKHGSILQIYPDELLNPTFITETSTY